MARLVRPKLIADQMFGVSVLSMDCTSNAWLRLHDVLIYFGSCYSSCSMSTRCSWSWLRRAMASQKRRLALVFRLSRSRTMPSTGAGASSSRGKMAPRTISAWGSVWIVHFHFLRTWRSSLAPTRHPQGAGRMERERQRLPWPWLQRKILSSP